MATILMCAVGNLLAVAAAATGARVGVIEERSVVILMRHGEKAKDSGDTLSPLGERRAEYTARCLGTAGVRTNATRAGPVVGVVASAWKKGHSHRPIDTARPLAHSLGLPLDAVVGKKDAHGLAAHLLPKLRPNGTVVVAWVHEEIAALVRALAPKLHLPHHFHDWPGSCDNARWREPHNLPGKRCYDEAWAVELRRPGGSARGSAWAAAKVYAVQQGFAGEADSACADDFAPLLGESAPARPTDAAHAVQRGDGGAAADKARGADEDGVGVAVGAAFDAEGGRGGVEPVLTTAAAPGPPEQSRASMRILTAMWAR